MHHPLNISPQEQDTFRFSCPKFFPPPLAPQMAAWEMGVPGSADDKGDSVTCHPAGLQLT